MEEMALPALCVDGIRVANARNCDFNVLNLGRGNSRAGVIMRVRRSVGEVGRWTKILGGQANLHLRVVFGGLILDGSKNGPFRRERFGRLCVRASISEEEKDFRVSQHVRERSDSEGEEDGVDKGIRIGEEVSVTPLSVLHEGNLIVPVVGSRRRFRSRFLGLVKLRTNIAEAAEGVFKSEIRRRIFVTIVLLMASRAGYFIPLPGFDRRSLPGDYLGFVSGAVGEKFTPYSRLVIF